MVGVDVAAVVFSGPEPPGLFGGQGHGRSVVADTLGQGPGSSSIQGLAPPLRQFGAAGRRGRRG